MVSIAPGLFFPPRPRTAVSIRLKRRRCTQVSEYRMRRTRFPDERCRTGEWNDYDDYRDNYDNDDDDNDG